MQLVCASANPDKVAEIQALLAGVVDLLPRPSEVPDVVEDADTLVGNARLKAAAIVAATGLPAVADDTGLEVDALGGEPGVYTARYAGEGCSYADNRHKMLAELDGGHRAWCGFQDGCDDRVAGWVRACRRGVCPGVISIEERGDVGFGYDAIFQPDEGTGLTFAEMTADAKHAISHRGRAFRQLLSELERQSPNGRSSGR